MRISSTYICPARGLSGLEPPELDRLSQAVGVIRDLGIECLMFPVLEESMMGASRARVQYLDDLHTHFPGLWDHFRE